MASNIDQNPFMRRRPSRLRWASLRLSVCTYRVAATWHWLSRRKQDLKSRLRRLAGQNAQREEIYAPHGSFFIFSRRYFEAGGYLDGNLFLYGEEISVAEICRAVGLPIVYEPSLRVVHDEHRSTGQTISRFSYECQKKAVEYISSRYLASQKV